MYKEEVQQSLLAWVRTTQATSAKSFSELWDGRILLELLRKIANFQAGELELIDELEPKIVLANLKRISKALAAHYDKHLRNKYDPEFVDLLSIAQNRNPLEIFKLTLQVFGACVQAPNKPDFINPIIKLKEEEQQHLMTLIKEHNFIHSSSQQQPPRQRKPSSEHELDSGQQTEIRALLNQVQKQETIIERLENELAQHKIARRELEKKLLVSEEECQRLRDEIDSGITNQQFLMPENIEIEKAAMQNQNFAMIENLKLQLSQQAEKHSRVTAELNDNIDFFKRNSEKLEKKIAELEATQEEAQREQGNSPSKSIYIDHPPCMSMTKHYELLSVKTQKISELQKLEWQVRRQMLDLKVENDQLTRQLNKLQQEISQKSELITRTDYDALKINILSLLNDRFKTEVAKLKEARP